MNKLGLLFLFLTFTTITSFAQAESQMDAKTFFSRMNGQWKADTDQSTTSEMLPKLQESNVSARVVNTGNGIFLETDSRYLSAQGEEVNVSSAYFFAVDQKNKVYSTSTSIDDAGQTEGYYEDGKMTLSWEMPETKQINDAKAILYFDAPGQLVYIQQFNTAAGTTLERKAVYVRP
ncbi:MAG: hypothetical protein GVY26_02060 [Bacteroidetes bacterium]|jgi:hypothetical protein|nr:hypothetical protein [Bacteroidota bacterium]